MTLSPFDLVIFDCDGVLVDSEPLSQALLREEALRLGWAMSDAEIHATTGLTWSALQPVFEAKLGMALPQDWPSSMQERLLPILAERVEPVPFARDALLAASQLGLPYRVASNSSHEEMEQKFRRTGLLPLVDGLTHSARDVARGKPAPDLFLAAAQAGGVAPGRCLVIEDSLPGITGALAAGMQVVAYAPDGAAGLQNSGAHAVIASLRDLPALFARHGRDGSLA